jgi:ketosteroid isomerase-like protein
VYTDDAVYWPGDTPAIEGKAAIRAASEPAPGMTIQDFTLTSLDVEGYGDVAVDRGTWTETFMVEGMPEATTLTGKHVVIARKQADGSWLWTLLIWNTDAPMPQFAEPPE